MVTTVLKHENMDVHTSEDVVRVRQTARLWSVELGFNLVNQTKFITAASELARNMLDFAGGGLVKFEKILVDDRQGLRLTFEDHGPGIVDLDLAMKDGYSTGDGLGLGLSGSRRLVDEFEIATRPGEGTWVTITTWK